MVVVVPIVVVVSPRDLKPDGPTFIQMIVDDCRTCWGPEKHGVSSACRAAHPNQNRHLGRTRGRESWTVDAAANGRTRKANVGSTFASRICATADRDCGEARNAG